MGGMQDKRQEPGKSREEHKRPQQPGQDPVHSEPGRPSRSGERPEETERHREDALPRDERDLRDDDF
ncbi:hypothetical protein ACFRDV_42810 [Streptomyces fagopyri]|uniref:hypothetical protein n=1 Tax=Streptomyces fagopyri TaxID=2662397 RepID=UPI0036BA7306